MSEVRFEEQFPEPLRCWIVHAPRRWPGPDGWWLDLAREELTDGTRGPSDLSPAVTGPEALGDLADVTYLPPVGAVGNWWRQELRERLTEAGADPIVQFSLGEEIEAGGGLPVLDLTPALLPPKLGLFDSVPAGVHCCWPLIPGLSSDERVCRQGLERLAAAGASGVHAVVPDLSSTARRRLGDLTGRRGYQELFHGARPEASEFARWANEAGLTAFLERPECGRSGRSLRNRNIATRLHLIGELVQRTHGSMDESLSFYRAGRWADREGLDIEDLARSGNLGLIPEVSDQSAREIELFVNRKESAKLRKLELEYLGSVGSAPQARL